MKKSLSIIAFGLIVFISEAWGSRTHQPFDDMRSQRTHSTYFPREDLADRKFVPKPLAYGDLKQMLSSHVRQNTSCDHQQQLACLRKSLRTKTLDAVSKVRAHYYLADVYRLGLEETAIDYKKARFHYKKVLHKIARDPHDFDPALKAQTYYHLADMYRRGQGTDVNYVKARNCFKNVLSIKEVDLELKAYTYYYFGQMYRLGQGTAVNYAKARNCFKKVLMIHKEIANGSLDPELKAYAHYYTAEMYRLDKAVKHGAQKAHAHYEKACASSVPQRRVRFGKSSTRLFRTKRMVGPMGPRVFRTKCKID